MSMFGRDGFVRDRVGDVYHYAPVTVGLIAVIGLAASGLDELQHLAIDVISG